MSSVVDDHLLVEVLAGAPSPWTSGERDMELFTTVSWYYRLARAAELDEAAGSLSAHIASLPPADQLAVRSQLLSLPDRVVLVQPRRLVPVMSVLGATRRPNFLGADALATAIVTRSKIVVRTDSPPLREACDALDVPYLVV